MNMPKPKSRPKCPSCYGDGKETDEMFGSVVPCFYCDGQGYDPYYTGKETERDAE